MEEESRIDMLYDSRVDKVTRFKSRLDQIYYRDKSLLQIITKNSAEREFMSYRLKRFKCYLIRNYSNLFIISLFRIKTNCSLVKYISIL